MEAIFLIAVSHVQDAAAIPVITTLETQIQQANGNLTALNTEIAPSWATTANIRSTSDLLWTSVLTLFICVYNVVHLNVPPPGEGRIGFITRKTKWVLISILAPEISLTMAIQQFIVARALSRDLTKFWNDSHSESGSDKKKSHNKFGMLYSHYAAMGGFVVDVSPMHNTLTRVTLLPSAISELAGQGHFLEIDPETIEDKSKADTLAKLLVCVQVTWMIIQCIGRKVAGLPISLLEIHILVHVTCALCMYALWMRKPFDVLEPTTIQSSEFEQTLALMLMNSAGMAEYYYLEIYNLEVIRPIEQNTNSHGLEIDSSLGIPTSEHTYISQTDLGAKTLEKSSEELIVNNTAYRPMPEEWTRNCVRGSKLKNPVCILYPGQSLKCGIGPPSMAEGHIKLSSKDILRWNLAAAAMKDYPEICQPGTHEFGLDKLLSAEPGNLANIAFSSNISKAFKAELWESPWFFIMLLACPLAYGGLHNAAADFHFPTSTEQLLWRISSQVVMVGIPGFILIFISGMAFFVTIFSLLRLSEDESKAGGLPIVVILVCLLVLSYSAARFFLIIESFISVRYLPIGVYVTVDWSNYIPHL